MTKVRPSVLETKLDILHPIHPDIMRKDSDPDEEGYLLGHSEAEIQRLINQAAILRPITERLLRSAGIDRGMRILDLGCGAGDVSMLAGKLVGSKGSVVGIDRNAQSIEVASARAQAEGLQHVAFVQASVDSFSDSRPFDLVIARYVLVHQADPVAFLQAAARFARIGGILALHEPVMDRPFHCVPAVDLWRQTADRLQAMVRAGVPSWDAASRLVEHFSNAGLPQPTLFSETPVGGGFDAPHYAWFTELTFTLLPQMIQAGLGTAETAAIEALERRLRSAVVEARGQVEGPGQMCAWISL
jgi:ubiquinone/menaquinone biosynthesis C-methylase UbiE